MAFTGKYFNSSYYLAQNADVAAGWASSALNHYMQLGATEGRAPSVWFDYQYYRTAYTDLATMDALQLFEHYELFGGAEGRATASAYQNFDEAKYLADYTDLGTAGITDLTALNHYVEFGINEGRSAFNDDGTAVTSSTAAVIYRLTTGVDNIIGAATNDTIDGSRIISGGAQFDGLGNVDSVDGGDGIDTLFVQTVTAVVTAITPGKIQNVEILSVENMAAGLYTLNLANGDALITTLKIANTTAGAISIINNPAALTTLEIENVSTAVIVTSLAAAVAGTTDVLALNLSSAVGAAGVSVAGYETINMVSDGTVANTIGVLTDANLTTLNISGAQNLTLVGGATSTALTAIDANTATGNMNVTLNAAQTQALSFTGGTGTNTINFGGTYTSADTVVGGTGADTIVLTSAEAVAATVAQANVSGVESVALSNIAGAGATISLTNFGATALSIATAGSAGALNLTYTAGTGSLALGAVAGMAGINTATFTGVATTDVFNVSIGNAAAGLVGGANAFVTVGAETVNISSVGAANTFGAAVTLTPTGSTETLNIVGNQNLTIIGAVTANAINASGMTGTAALTMTVATVAAAGVSITGTANGDTLFGSAAADIISGGAGADFITGGALADILTGGAGIDQFSFAVGDSTAAALTKVSDFVNGTDNLQFTGVVDVVSAQQAAVQAAVTALGAGAADAAIAAAMAAANTTNLGVAFAAYGGNSYVYFQTTGAGGVVPGADVFVELTGVTEVPTFANDVVA